MKTQNSFFLKDENSRHFTLLRIFGGIFLIFTIIDFFIFNCIEWNAFIPFRQPLVFFNSALMGSFVIYAFHRPERKRLIITLALGIILEILFWFIRGAALKNLATDIGWGLGGAAICGMLLKRIHAKRKGRGDVPDDGLYAALLIPLYIMISIPALFLTSLLHPVVSDPGYFITDRVFGHPVQSSVKWLFDHIPGISATAGAIYVQLPLLFSLLYGYRKFYRPQSLDVLTSFVIFGAFGYILYHILPVVGPVHFHQFLSFAVSHGLIGDALPASIAIPTSAPRNCVPSLHTAWALLLFLNTVDCVKKIRFAGAFALLFTLLATIGFGYHYVIDLIIAVPFVAALRGWLLWDTDRSGLRRNIIVANIALFCCLILLVEYSPGAFNHLPLMLWLLTGFICVAFFYFDRKLYRSAGIPTETAPAPKRTQPIEFETHLTFLFVFSGFAGLTYEVVFAKSLALTFGSTATASTTVLATYMGGLALGSWLGGRIASHSKNSVRLYALCEAGIALFCIATPWLFPMMQKIYIALAGSQRPDSPVLVALQFGLGSLVLLPPTILMGLSTPALTRFFEDRVHSLGDSVGRLYAANTVGAGLGALLTGYVIIPTFGIRSSTMLAVALNLLAALLGFVLSRKVTISQAPNGSEQGAQESSTTTEKLPLRFGIAAIAILILGGFVTLAAETVYIHLLAVVAGNSVYAFALILFCFLIGLSAGAWHSRRRIKQGSDPMQLIVFWELALAACMLAGTFIWSHIPSYFASYAQYPFARSFAEREFIRGVACSLAMIPIAYCIGGLFPAAMEAVGRSWKSKSVLFMGRASALNTVGNIVGAIVGGFILIPALGSLLSIQLLASIAVAGALIATAIMTNRPWFRLAIGYLFVFGLFLAQPAQFDMDELASGANVYFSRQAYGKTIAHAESLDGGLTTVASSTDGSKKEVYTLLTNGKFQGDNSWDREVLAQYGFALIPMLHTPSRDRTLVIGYGTGVSATAFMKAGFREIHIAELSGDVLDLADQYFKDVNENVLHAPHVHSYVTDGRNFLLLNTQKYDLISMEVSSIWFAGAASLYHTEYYRLAKSRLRKGGVLQQWIQLHRLNRPHLRSIIASLRHEFENVWLYFVQSQGILVACDGDCRPSEKSLLELKNAEKLSNVFERMNGIENLLKMKLLSPPEVDGFLQETVMKYGLTLSDIISTDDNLYLEYETPKGNVRNYQSSLKENLAWLSSFSAPSNTGP